MRSNNQTFEAYAFAREEVIRALQLARWRHMMHLSRQRPYHGARTNCRWHEGRHQPEARKG